MDKNLKDKYCDGCVHCCYLDPGFECTLWSLKWGGMNKACGDYKEKEPEKETP